MDVPIKQLAQNVQILDENGKVVGTLNTPYADATTVGSKVSTKTPPAPLVVGVESRETYTAFVGALNLAANYTLGLRGTADSMLNLGPFGLIEIKGIPLDVKTTMAGLQGLNDIKFVSLVQMYPDFMAGFTFVTTVVNIHNPSQLTLNIGDMGMAAGFGGYEDSNRIGYTQLYGLRLVPGDNIMPSLLGQGYTAPAVEAFSAALTTTDPAVTLWANSTATSNPALNAGLASLKTTLILPKDLKVANPPPLPYNDVWTVKFLPTTMTDGLVEMTAVFNNPFLYEFSLNGESTSEENFYVPNPGGIRIQAPGYNAAFPFIFTDGLKFTLKAGESRSVTFKVKLQKVGAQANMLKFVEGILPAAAAGTIKLEIFSAPRANIPGFPITTFPDYSSILYYPATSGVLTLKTGSDFPMIKDWFYKEYAYTPAPVAPVASTTEPALPPTTPTVAPSPTSSPEATTPPVAPAA